MPLFAQPSSKGACFHPSEHRSINWNRPHATPSKTTKYRSPVSPGSKWTARSMRMTW